MGNFTSKHKWGVFVALVLTVLTQLVYAQSGSTGSAFVHSGGEKGIFGLHNFQNGTGTISAGIIGSERQPAIGVYSFVNPNGSWVGASDQAFVDGYVRTYNSGPFTFPIGDNDKYRPAAVSASASAAPTTAAYYGVDPGTATTSDLKGGTYGILPGGGPAFPTTSKDVNVGTVDNIEYWDIDGTTPARITLTWDASTPISAMTGGDLNKLTIVGWDGNQWVVIPSTVDAGSLVLNTSASAFTGPAGTVSAGSITTNADVVPGSFTVYTLAGLEIQTPCSLTVTASASQTAVCVGGSVTLSATVSPAGSYTYSWSGPNGFTSDQPNPAATNLQPGDGGGLFTVTVTDANGCTETQTVSVNVQIPNVIVTSNSPQCAGNTLSFSATGGMTSYAWTGPNGFNNSSPNPAIPNATTAATGSYTLVVVDALGCTASFVTSATIADQPSLTVTAAPSLTICSGASTTLTVSGNNGSPVTWSSSLGLSGSGNAINFAGLRNLSSQPQSVTFVVEATAGSCTDREVIILTINPEPMVQVVPSAAIYCDIEQVKITVTASPATAMINWTRTPTTPGTASGNNVGTVLIDEPLPAANYVYTFTATDVNGCSSGPVSVPVTVQQ
ncbi:PKD domain-containing protein [Larkinella sp. VNQ87]|uniref:PKD domain-containing protein n=1 Tax=Larkinella sp. VNQ87 TaxID=3400921 RepID=UPI003C036E03